MVKSFYLDTAIWRDYFEDRRDGIRPLGEFAFQFLKKCREHNCKVLYSEPVLFELRDFPKQRVDWAFSSFKDLLVAVPVLREQMREAKQIAEKRRLPFNDVFHAIIARDNNAMVITRDRHFDRLLDVVESKAPEEVTFG